MRMGSVIFYRNKMVIFWKFDYIQHPVDGGKLRTLPTYRYLSVKDAKENTLAAGLAGAGCRSLQ